MVFDRDGDGVITPAEIRHVMKTLGEILTDEEIDEIMTEGDKDGNGVLSFEEFKDLMMAK